LILLNKWVCKIIFSCKVTQLWKPKIKALNLPPRLLRYAASEMKRFGLICLGAIALASCGTSPQPAKPTPVVQPQSIIPTPGGLALRDTVIYSQKDKDLNQRLTKTDSYTDKGWLIWDGIRRVTEGRAVATYYDQVDGPTIDGCMARGEYPMVQFYLPNGRSHWSMIVKHDARGYHMRDPLRVSEKPLIFPAGVKGYRAVRCIGLAKQ